MLTISSLPDFVASGRAPEELKREEQIPTLVIEWDRAPGAFWTLRLCEYFGANGVRWDYPTPAPWVASDEGRLEYADHPASADRSISARASVTATTQESDELSFQVTLKNDSAETWRDSWCWVCLIHRWAGAFQANCELPTGTEDDPWAPSASLRAPKGRWLKWCPIREHRMIGERIAQQQRHMWQPHIEASQGAVRAWRMDLEEPIQQFIQMSSANAIMLGWSHWPCTDMGLYFRSLAPGETGVVSGNLRVWGVPYTRI